jgi:hypothetical protein
MDFERDGTQSLFYLSDDLDKSILLAAFREEITLSAQRYLRLRGWLSRAGLIKPKTLVGLSLISRDLEETDTDTRLGAEISVEDEDLALVRDALKNFTSDLRTSAAISKSAKNLGIINNPEIENRLLYQDLAHDILSNLDKYLNDDAAAEAGITGIENG